MYKAAGFTARPRLEAHSALVYADPPPMADAVISPMAL